MFGKRPSFEDPMPENRPRRPRQLSPVPFIPPASDVDVMRRDLERLIHELEKHHAELEVQVEERRRTQVQLAAAQDSYYQLWQLAPVTYLIVDAEGTIREANASAGLIYRLPHDRVVGRPFASFLSVVASDSFHETLRRILAGNGDRREQVNLDLRCPDGQIRHVRCEVCARPPPPGVGKSVEILAVLTDVTSIKHAEESIRRLNQELADRVSQLTWTNVQLENEIRERARLSEVVERSQRQLRLLSQRMITTQEEERRRIARELHDDTGQRLGALVAELRALEESAADPERQEKVHRLRQSAAEMLQDVRVVAQGLHPTVIERSGLGPAIQRLAANFSAAHDIPATVELDGLENCEPFSGALKVGLYRVLQEALNNIVRHGRATRVSIVLLCQPASVRLIVEDDGRGFDPDEVLARAGAETPLGLLGMRERIAQLAGRLQIESSPGNGTTIAAEIPLATREPS
jgi:PAS domain S-box-containing protein